MYALDKNFIQKYAAEYVKEGFNDERGRYYYEFTVTFDPKYWSKLRQFLAVPWVIADVLKPIIGNNGEFQIRYSVEYTEKGNPHIHGQIKTKDDIHPDIQRQIFARLTRRYGRSQWYQTEEEDMFHETSKMKWSDYIKKHVMENNLKKGCLHYFEYYLK